MIAPARASRLSLVVHAVDGSGALCGVDHRRARLGRATRWQMTERLPVNCPRCLFRLGGVRWALCETPMASSIGAVHLRKVGHEGISLSGNQAGSTTLCGIQVGWDLRELESLETARELRDVCPRCRVIGLGPHMAEARALPSAHAVR